MTELVQQSQHQALKNAAEQFAASYKAGDVATLLDYFEDIFKDALSIPGETPEEQKESL